MTKFELIAGPAAGYAQWVAEDVERAVNAALDAIAATMLKGHGIEIRGFGGFRVNHRAARSRGHAILPKI